MDLNALLQSSLAGLTSTTDARVKQLNEQTAAMTAETQRIEGLMTGSTTVARNAANAAAQVAGQRAGVQAEVDTAIQRIDDLFGVDPDQNNSVIQQRMAEYTSAEDARKAVRKEYDSLTGASLLSNPVTYILNQLKLPTVAAQHNALVDMRDAAAGDIATRQRLATAQRSAQLPNVAQKLKEVSLADAEAKRLQAEAEIQSREATMASQMAGQKLQIYSLSDRALQAQGDLFSKQLSFASIQAQRDATEEARAQRLAILTETANRQKADAEDIQAMDDRLGAVSDYFGLGNNRITVKKLRALGNTARKDAWFAAASGQLGKNLAASVAFAQSEANLAEMGRTNPYGPQVIRGFASGLRSIQDDLMRQARSDPGLAATMRKPDDAAALVSNAYTTELIDSMSSLASRDSLLSPRYDVLFNPYRTNHKAMLVAAQSDPRLANNAMVKALQASQIGKETQVAASPNIPVELERNAFLSIIEQVKGGTLGVDDAAAQITQYYTAGAKNNFDKLQYNLYSLPAQTNYMVTLPPPGMFSDPVKADLMNFASTKTAIAKYARQSAVSETRPMGQSVMPIGGMAVPVAPPPLFNFNSPATAPARTSPSTAGNVADVKLEFPNAGISSIAAGVSVLTDTAIQVDASIKDSKLTVRSDAMETKEQALNRFINEARAAGHTVTVGNTGTVYVTKKSANNR